MFPTHFFCIFQCFQRIPPESSAGYYVGVCLLFWFLIIILEINLEIRLVYDLQILLVDS